MRRIVIVGLVLALLGAGVWVVRGRSQADSAADAATAQAETLPPVQASDEVVADAKVVPVQRATLSLPVGGIVAEVAVAEGESARAGAILLRLDDARQQAAVTQAEAGVAQAAAAVTQAEAAVTQAQSGVTQAEAGVQRAQAGVAELQAGPRPQEVEAAEAAVAAAQAQLARVTQGARPEEVAAAQASVAAAQAGLAEVREGPAEEQLIAARAEVANAQAAVQQAQAAYDEVAYRPDIGALPQSLQLQQATNTLQAAQARLDELQRGVSEAAVDRAQAQVDQAQAQLNALRAAARPADVAAAQAEINRAQAQLELVQAGMRPETIAAAQADVASAQANVAAAQGSLAAAEAGLQSAEAALDAAEASLAQAEVALAETVLRAPFAGTLAALDTKEGEQVAPGSPTVTLADLSAWEIETDDLTELAVVRIQEGDTVTIRFDALPDLELPGTVTRIRPIGENKQGDITYTVLITPAEQHPDLRWNMTAAVTIAASEE